MKTAIVISDTHARRGALEAIAPLFAENDFVIHLGDGARDVQNFVRNIPGQPPKLYQCRGNCDLAALEEEFVFETEGTRIFCCHGHRYGVKTDLAPLARRARELGCSAALFGHTHVAVIDEIAGVLCINPGSLGDFAAPSYCYLAVHGGKITPVIVPVRG